jgi:polyisoprenoid-binding protein YceI
MKRHLLAALLALSFADAAFAANYAIDARHTQVLFTYTHMGFSHITGRFNEVSGTFDFDPAAPGKSSIEVDLPIASLSTGIAKLDEDMRSATFFDAEKFPSAHFKSNKATSTGKDRLDVAGDLTIHGVTQPVVFQVTINGVGEHPFKKVPAAGFDASATIKRSAFGVGAMVPIGSDEVLLHITLEAQQAAAN